MNDQYGINLVQKINTLKKEKNAIILAHNYQKPEVFDVADFTGDSLNLCISAQNTDADLILFCGVYFMAESAAILNPQKKVIVPYIDAGCAMADMVSVNKLEQLKINHPNAAVVAYINSTAEIKALSDICCTSSNAVKIVKGLFHDEIIFLPDKNLANYVQSQIPEKRIIPYPGFCPMHQVVDSNYVKEMRKTYPKAKLLVHPESKQEIIEMADYVTSTSGMIDCAKNDPSEEFFAVTECGMTERLHRSLPNKKFYGLCNMCFDMKKNDLTSILKSLINEEHVVKVEQEIANKARSAFVNMFNLT